ncbi:MAG: hypothetical protein AAF224_02895 [Pseudomonadota bacterium]
MIAPDAAKAINKELHPGEELLWADKPRRVPPYITSFIIIVIGSTFAILTLILYDVVADTIRVRDISSWSIDNILAAWRHTSEAYRAGIFNGLVGLAGTIFILVLTLGPSCLLIATERYALTDRRLIVKSRFWNETINPWNIAGICRESDKKLGTIWLAPKPMKFSWIANLYSTNSRFILHEIRNPKEVERLLIERFAPPTTSGDPS